MKIDRIGACVAVLAFGFFCMAAVSECDARNPRLRELYSQTLFPDLIPSLACAASIPRMSPDGSYIIFPDDSQRIFSVYTDGSRLYQIPDGPSAPEFFVRDERPDISPDGSRVVYSTFRHSTGMLWNRVHSYEIATAKPDGSDVNRLTRNEYDDRSPVWSPDGRRIAFVSDRDGNSRKIYTMNSDGSDVRRIAPSSGGSPKLVWSPGGRHIAFRQFDRGEWDAESDSYIGTVYFVAIVGSDGSGFRRIMESASPISEPAWSPDRQRMVFTTTGDKMLTLYIVDAEGANPHQVVAISMSEPPVGFAMTTPYNQRVSWDSGGSEILVHYSYGIKNFVHSVRPDGTDFHTLHEGRASGSVVSVDGSRVIVYSCSDRRDGEVVLSTMALDGSD